MKITKYNINISRLRQYILNFSSLILAILLVFFLASKIYQLTLLFSINLVPPSNYLLEDIFTYIFYFQFIALIIKCFQSKNYFPLRYFIYIGIATIVCLIIVVYKSVTYINIYNKAILLLVLALYFTNTEKIKYKL
ncbi:phosphate-starvation-inducible protein PsiE [Arsenophonus sp. aPb]|uniref:phosphate-starvation-inducible protein PsiE n=1 Tax=Arsenophonus sp. aPb TaxID=3041619 RepID=UPI0024684148|nr:phosphate-starvation-inducible PsiE family protein [Arsenophonus sp. aPb]WGL97203.1 phosphate-starvation-inducible protein PsiE [Arsenophonus sp. aPb]